MNCYLCKEEKNEFTNKYVEPVCTDCNQRMEDSNKIREDFMAQYKEDHEACPRCGSIKCQSGLVAYVFYSDRPQDFKDHNTCICVDCGDRHTRHSRVPLAFFECCICGTHVDSDGGMCRSCERPVCEDCSVPYTMHNQIDYTLCSSCYRN